MAITATSTTINSAGVIWSFAAGAAAMEPDDDDLSVCFTPVAQTAQDQTGHQSLQRRRQPPTRRRSSLKITDCSTFSIPQAPPTIDENSESNDNSESLSLYSRKSGSSCSSSGRSSYSSREWAEAPMAPSALLSKMMPSEVKKAEEILSQRQQTTRYSLYKMTRSEVRLQLQSSFCKLDSLNDLPSFQKQQKRDLSSHISAPCFESSKARGLGKSTQKKEAALMSMLRADLQPKPEKSKSKKGSSKRTTKKSKGRAKDDDEKSKISSSMRSSTSSRSKSKKKSKHHDDTSKSSKTNANKKRSKRSSESEAAMAE
ncbi:unnamed protein product [Cylindrotheca closterium]|uniref:Uncharacterized protein n=1 Tax=Cylindrotheca closterium TaxID=2856 RepID=A0AAD2G271_9STRA|nr:unnamed protein product [Cylindrotheca closterium]